MKNHKMLILILFLLMIAFFSCGTSDATEIENVNFSAKIKTTPCRVTVDDVVQKCENPVHVVSETFDVTIIGGFLYVHYYYYGESFIIYKVDLSKLEESE